MRSGARARRNINNEGAYEKVRVRGERVDGVVAEDVALLKMDVEGFEPTAFESAKGVLDTFKCALTCQHIYSVSEHLKCAP